VKFECIHGNIFNLPFLWLAYDFSLIARISFLKKIRNSAIISLHGIQSSKGINWQSSCLNHNSKKERVEKKQQRKEN
jgi:hypothetical protein